MSELDAGGIPQSTEAKGTEDRTKTWKNVFWTLLQPTIAMGAPLLVAVTLLNGTWDEADRKLFALMMIFLPIPLFVGPRENGVEATGNSNPRSWLKMVSGLRWALSLGTADH